MANMQSWVGLNGVGGWDNYYSTGAFNSAGGVFDITTNTIVPTTTYIPFDTPNVIREPGLSNDYTAIRQNLRKELEEEIRRELSEKKVEIKDVDFLVKGRKFRS